MFGASVEQKQWVQTWESVKEIAEGGLNSR